jgi:hypothetical protein
MIIFIIVIILSISPFSFFNICMMQNSDKQENSKKNIVWEKGEGPGSEGDFIDDGNNKS